MVDKLRTIHVNRKFKSSVYFKMLLVYELLYLNKNVKYYQIFTVTTTIPILFSLVTS